MLAHTYATRHALRALALLALLALLAWPAASPAAAADKSFVYERDDVDLALAKDGTLDVTERLTLRYTGGPFSSASRAIALRRLDAVEAPSVAEGGVAYREAASADSPGSFSVERADDKVTVRWRYAPTSDSRRTFTLRYRVRGALRVGQDTDELWWVAVFADRSVPVEHMRVRLALPDSVDVGREAVSLPAAEGSVAMSGGVVEVTRDEPLAPGKSLDVKVELPAAQMTAATPEWQQGGAKAAPASAGDDDPVVIAIGLAILAAILAVPVALVVGVIWLVRRQLRRGGAAVVVPVAPGAQPKAASRSFSSGSSSSGDHVWSTSSDSSSSWSSSSSDSSSWSSSDSSSWSSSDSGSSWSSSDSGGSGGGGGDAN